MIDQLVDSHVHFWNPEAFDIAWLAGLDVINKTFLPQHLQAASPAKIQKMVFVQADVAEADGQREAAWVTDLAGQHPVIAGIVAFAPLENLEKARTYLEEYAGNPLIKGIRRLIQSEEPGFARQEDFIEGVRSLNAYGYSFDICVRHHQLPDVLALVEACPDINFVLDHLGKPAAVDQLTHPWADHIRLLAQFPNVACKLSGLITEARPHKWTIDDLRFYTDCILQNFGTERVMYGGDWPVVNLAGDYDQWVRAADTLTTGLSSAEREAIFIHNAVQFYQLD